MENHGQGTHSTKTGERAENTPNDPKLISQIAQKFEILMEKDFIRSPWT